MTDYVKADGADSELVGAALMGDRAAFGRIVERYQSLLCSIAYSATGNLAQSEDCAQEAFVAAWKQLASLQQPARLRSWLCGIVRNIANNTVRRCERDAVSRAEPIEEITDSAAVQTPAIDQVITAEEERILWRSLESIPEIYREPSSCSTVKANRSRRSARSWN
jgi:RNA polymerase sigma factor (sigma-70 family)